MRLEVEAGVSSEDVSVSDALEVRLGKGERRLTLRYTELKKFWCRGQIERKGIKHEESMYVEKK